MTIYIASKTCHAPRWRAGSKGSSHQPTRPGEVLKGALVEVGAALAAGKEVRCVGECESVSPVFRKHPNWRPKRWRHNPSERIP